MKLHSDTLNRNDICEALAEAKRKGRVDSDVHFDILEARGSRTRKAGFEIRLEWLGEKVKGDGRRPTNSGNRGGGSQQWAALWEEWGWFILELFRKDSGLVFGSYKSLDDFHSQTRFAFTEG
jgi:hypothetical protein